MKTEVYCSFCRLPHKVYTKSHVSVVELGAFSLISAIASFWFWRDFHWAACGVFIVLSVWAEFMYRIRYRQSVKCKNCGFDPFVYKETPEMAAKLVKEFLERRKEDPLYLLKPQPQIQPIVKKVHHREILAKYKGDDASN